MVDRLLCYIYIYTACGDISIPACSTQLLQCYTQAWHGLLCALYRVHYVVSSVQRAACSVQRAVCSVQSSVFSVHCALFRVHYVLGSVQCPAFYCVAQCYTKPGGGKHTIYTGGRTLYSARDATHFCTLHTVHCTMYSARDATHFCTLHNVHWTLDTVQYVHINHHSQHTLLSLECLV